jgi:hypothetical protein
MDKVFYSDDNDALIQACQGVSAWFIDQDHVKSAASSAFSTKLVRQHVPDDNHFAIHLVAMGCGESYSSNKNGDFWTRAGLMHDKGDYGAHTFVKHGHYFLEHKNRDPKVARGSIKAAAYNREMDRVELIVWGNKRKAEEDYQMAKSGKTLTFSMSARVPSDFCSICDHEAKSSREYCACLKQHMTRWMPSHSKFAYAVNRKPKFFDISRVQNPADRIAHFLQYVMAPGEEMAKAAAAFELMFSDMQAERSGICLPADNVTGCATSERQAILEKLASYERFHQDVLLKPNDLSKDAKFNFATQVAPYAFAEDAISDEQMKLLQQMPPDVCFGHLAKRAAVLPFAHFWAYANMQTVKQAAADPVFHYAQEMLPNVFTTALRMPSAPEIEGYVTPGVSAKLAACNIGDPIEQLMDSVAGQLTIDKPQMRIRVMRICASSPRPSCACGAKMASEIIPDQKAYAREMARAYALYKVAFVEALSEQTPIDEASMLLITYPWKV